MRPAMITHAFAWESTMASTRMAARGARDGVVVLSAQSRRGQECGIMIQLYMFFIRYIMHRVQSFDRNVPFLFDLKMH
jgi:hypothetical protein